jgi:ribonuclease BN (tRNA processing enzyme)
VRREALRYNQATLAGPESCRVSDLRLTVLGASPAWANPGWACSGYLVSADNEHVLLDCGFGVLSRLRERLPLDNLRAVVISHLHADHFIDLVSLRYGLKYGSLRSDPALPLYVPPRGASFLAKLGEALDGDAEFFAGTYRLAEYDPSEELQLGALSVRFSLVKHYITAYAMAVRAGRRLVYSGDAAPCSALVELARGADVLLCEAGINGPHEDDPNPSNRGHMTAQEAARLAAEAGVGRLLLTHYKADPDRQPGLQCTAGSGFAGQLEFVREGRVYTI